ncbi:TonB family protein [Microbulbifer sp. SAOS-129_SWC]|uniref:TonB family protein n=1 Tax=Microbulbifer sp. SAOS-129_SWC TaxID=3145235 RepID=UPI003217D44F
MKPIKFVIALMVFATALSVQAAPLLNGLALGQEFNKDRYIAAVYADPLAESASSLLDNGTPRRLEVRIIADSLSARRFRNQWMEGIAINNPSSTLSGQADNMVTFAKMFHGRLKKGDHLSVDFTPASGTTTVALNGVTLGKVEDRNFFNTLLRAWVGAVPPSSEFRDGLLAAGDVDSGMLGRYELLKPGSTRVAQVREQVQARSAAAEEETVASAEPAMDKPKPKAPLASADIPPPTLASIGDKAASAAKKATTPKSSKPQPSKSKPAKTVAKRAPVPADEDDEDEDEAPLTADLILARQLYHSQLLRYTYGFIKYPKRAQQRGQEGTVMLSVTINANGQVTDVQGLQDSRFSALNRAAREAVRDASPYPSAPAQLVKSGFKFTLPITFQLKD